MGVRSFLKGKIEKHGGVAGLARAAAAKPANILSGGRGTRSSAPAPEARADVIQAALADLPTEPDADGYRAVAPASMVQPGKAGQFDVNGTTVAVFRVGGDLFAIDNACLHEDGPLGESDVEGHVATCPYHNWKYDLRDGTCLTHPGRRLGSYPVREKGGFLWVGRSRSRSSEDRGGEHDDGLKVV
jgi:nitrite reductase/ring-hydroxylating ferredoxin subunit